MGNSTSSKSGILVPPFDYSLSIWSSRCWTLDFFDKIANAEDGTEKLNIVREMFRLLTPNSNSFSKINDAADPENVQSRQIWATTMIANQSPDGPTSEPQTNRIINYDRYRPEFWFSANGFNTDICSFDPPSTPEDCASNVDPTALFKFSEVDNDPQYNDGTVIQKQNEKIEPVLEKPLYCTFGLGYRRCP